MKFVIALIKAHIEQNPVRRRHLLLISDKNPCVVIDIHTTTLLTSLFGTEAETSTQSLIIVMRKDSRVTHNSHENGEKNTTHPSFSATVLSFDVHPPIFRKWFVKYFNGNRNFLTYWGFQILVAFVRVRFVSEWTFQLSFMVWTIFT